VIEQIGVGRSLEKMEAADIVVYIFDAGEVGGEDAGGAVGSGNGFRRTVYGSEGENGGGGAEGGDVSGGAEQAVSGKSGAGGAEGSLRGGRGGAGGGVYGGEGENGDGGVEGAGSSHGVAAAEEMNEMQREMKVAGEDLAAVREDLVRRGKAFLLVGNKVDVFAGGAVAVRYPEEVLISARDGRGVDVLKQRLVDLVLQGEAAGDGTMVTNVRHYQMLVKVAEALGAIRKGLDDLLSGDLLALDIRVALHYLGEITGEITTEDRLGYIFSKFCVGK
jgi:tRNA U34 5-carboxymethylaminomethyl modifying GTPase MnmE/TrmE